MAGEQSTEAATTPRKRQSILRIALMLVVPTIVIGIGIYLYVGSARYVSTDNAYVQQDIVEIGPELGGRIVEVLIRENDRVEAGDILFRIDPDPWRIAIEQAEADIAAAQLDLTRAETVVATSDVDIAAAREDIAFAQRNLARERELMNRGFNTRSRVEAFEHDLAEAQERLNTALAARENARAAVGRAASGRRQVVYPAIAAAQARRNEAALNLRRTVIRAPVSGTVSQSARLLVGRMAEPGVPLVSIVASDNAWIEANFKETELDRMRIGQPARITFDAYPDLVLAGRVASIGAGTGSEFSILPAQNATGNWVKVTQRVPVRIAIEGNPPRAMIAGLSARVRVDIRDDGER